MKYYDNHITGSIMLAASTTLEAITDPHFWKESLAILSFFILLLSNLDKIRIALHNLKKPVSEIIKNKEDVTTE